MRVWNSRASLRTSSRKSTRLLGQEVEDDAFAAEDVLDVDNLHAQVQALGEVLATVDLFLGDLLQVLLFADVVGGGQTHHFADALGAEGDLAVGVVAADLIFREPEPTVFVRAQLADQVAKFQALVRFDDEAGRRSGHLGLVVLEQAEIVHAAVADQHEFPLDRFRFRQCRCWRRRCWCRRWCCFRHFRIS